MLLYVIKMKHSYFEESDEFITLFRNLSELHPFHILLPCLDAHEMPVEAVNLTST
jgi:hypothetical protein